MPTDEPPWVDRYLISSMRSLYEGGRACVRLGSRGGVYFEVRRGFETMMCNIPVGLQYFL